MSGDRDLGGRKIGFGRRLLLAFDLFASVMSVLVFAGMGLLGIALVALTVFCLVIGSSSLWQAIGMFVGGGFLVLCSVSMLRGVRKWFTLRRRAILGDMAAASEVQCQTERAIRSEARFNGPPVLMLCVVMLGVALLARDMSIWWRIASAGLGIIGGLHTLRSTVRAWRS